MIVVAATEQLGDAAAVSRPRFRSRRIWRTRLAPAGVQLLASALARLRSGAARGSITQVRQVTPLLACSCSSCASTPARISELLPQPESP